MTRQVIDSFGRAVPAFAMKNGQVVSYTGTAGVIATAIADDCKMIMFWCTSDAYVRIGAGVTDADSTDIPVPAGAMIFHPKMVASAKVAAKQVTTGGSLHVVECY